MDHLESTIFGQVSGLFNSPIRISALLDDFSVGIVVLDLKRRVMFFNRYFEIMSGFNREEAVGAMCRDIMRSNFCNQNCPLVQNVQNEGPTAIEGDIINSDHQKIPVRLTSVELKDIKGNDVGFLETVEDLRVFRNGTINTKRNESFDGLIGRSPKMEELYRLVPVVAQTDSTILITGETGSGKDVLADTIHKSSDRTKGSFIKINCGALPETLLESELFGHTKGAFTGAVSDKPGRLRLAHNGTLYLNEIGDLPLSLQVKLLGFLDDKVVYPLGSTRGFSTDVRVIAATHRDLERMVKDGLFRQDLLFRLNVIRLHLPPLRERDGDVGIILNHYLKVFCNRFGKKISSFSESVQHFLFSYSYPGNIRELRNIVEYATNMCQSDCIDMEHLPPYLPEMGLTQQVNEETNFQNPETTRAGKISSDLNWPEIERGLIVETLLKVNGHRSKAAEILGWGRSTLWRKMRKYNLE